MTSQYRDTMLLLVVQILLGAQILRGDGASAEESDTIPNKSSRVLGGHEAVPHSYPSLILGKSASTKRPDYYAAVLIHPAWVLSCGSAAKQLHGHLFFAGRHNKFNSSGEGDYPHSGVGHTHPGFNISATGSKDDIALFRIQNPFELNEKVQPVAVATDAFPLPETTTIVGWGIYNLSSHYSSSTVLEADAPIMPNERCAELWNAEGKPNRVWNCTICVGEVNGTNACYGELGGPLYAKVEGEDGKRQVLVGILSNPGCFPKEPEWKNIMSVYMRVATYIDWIENVTGLRYEAQGNAGYGYFKDPPGRNGDIAAHSNSPQKTEAVLKLASGLAGSVCSQIESYLTKKSLPPPIKKRPAAAQNGKCGSFQMQKCGQFHS